MMQEVCVMEEQMSEEEILACLVKEDEADPKLRSSNVPAAKKAKAKETKPKEGSDQDVYMMENRRLLEVIVRLEQENDNLAQRLISGKVDLRKDLDMVKKRVDGLVQDLVQTRHQLQISEQQKLGQQEECDMVKETFWNEMKKKELQIKRSTAIIADYKQVCCQLTERMEKEQDTHTQQMALIKSKVRSCPHCRHVVPLDQTSTDDQIPETTANLEIREKISDQRENQENEVLKALLQKLEQDLVQTKLQMVEAQCRIQVLEHQTGILTHNLQEAKNSWIIKAFSSLHRDGTHTVTQRKHTLHTDTH
ncbi:rab GTPase-activating protein 1-like [Gouania willdenowi]|uniref:Rab GTPase-activating protein 1-like n=1 Tax=Gouania willdenowi TaxID=441366 RepID=A0A8C5I154_GOUWI|nr:rab GTPase-activating protein 1-like [Gouania willdenowi]